VTGNSVAATFACYDLYMLPSGLVYLNPTPLYDKGPGVAVGSGVAKDFQNSLL
jgi:hypothetical protein